MPKRNRTNGRRILADIRSGMGDIPIMERHGLSPRLYSLILDNLRRSGSIGDDEAESRIASCGGLAGQRERRRFERHHLLYRVPVHSSHDPDVRGTLDDISENGLRVSGIEAEVDELVSFLIFGEAFLVHPSFGLDAICRWSRQASPSTPCVAGFEITDISRECLDALKHLVTTLAVEAS